VQLAMVRATERYRVFVADLAAKSARLGKGQVMGVGRLFGADQAGLAAHEAEMFLVAAAHRLGDGEGAVAPAVNCRRGSFRGTRIGVCATACCGDKLDRPRLKWDRRLCRRQNPGTILQAWF